jgi:hypothetical protein
MNMKFSLGPFRASHQNQHKDNKGIKGFTLQQEYFSGMEQLLMDLV